MKIIIQQVAWGGSQSVEYWKGSYIHRGLISQENDRRQLVEQPWRQQSMPGDRIKLQQMQWKIGTKGKPSYLWGSARWTSWGIFTTTQKHDEKHTRENQRVQPAGWNWHLDLRHTKECLEATTQESRKEQAQQDLARQQAQWRGGY